MYSQSMFQSKNKKICIPCKPHFYHIKVRCKGVFITRTCYHDVGISYIELHKKVTGSYYFFLSVISNFLIVSL